MGTKRSRNIRKARKQGSTSIREPEREPKRVLGTAPVFGLSEMASDYCITRCSKPIRAAFASELRRLSQLSWGQIHSTHRKGMGCEKIYLKQIRKQAVTNALTEDIDSLRVFRFGGNGRMGGYKKEDLFQTIFVDENFEVYDHG